MALETLRGVTEIAGFSVVDMSRLKEERPDVFRSDGSMKYDVFEKEIRPNNFIYVRPDVNSISFTIQKGPVKENGVNGCQVDTLIAAAAVIIEKLNCKFPSEYNRRCITSLNEALSALEERKEDREKRGVEGFNKK